MGHSGGSIACAATTPGLLVAVLVDHLRDADLPNKRKGLEIGQVPLEILGRQRCQFACLSFYWQNVAHERGRESLEVLV